MRVVKIKLLQRRAIRAVRTIPGFFDTEPIFFDLKILNFENQYKLQLSSLMWDYDHIMVQFLLLLIFYLRELTLYIIIKRMELLMVICVTLKLIPQNTVSFKYQGINIQKRLKKLNIYKDR